MNLGRDEYVREMASASRLPELRGRVCRLQREAALAIEKFGEAEVNRVAMLLEIELLSQERELLRKEAEELASSFKEQGVRMEWDDDGVTLEFETESGPRRLVIVRGNGPRVLDGNEREIELPADIFISISGFAARKEFAEAVTVLSAHFEKEE